MTCDCVNHVHSLHFYTAQSFLVLRPTANNCNNNNRVCTKIITVYNIILFNAKYINGQGDNHDSYQLTPTRDVTSAPVSPSPSLPSRCPNHVVDDDVSQAAMLCLLCGKMLCTNSYCCMFEVEDGSQLGRTCTSTAIGEQERPPNMCLPTTLCKDTQ